MYGPSRTETVPSAAVTGATTSSSQSGAEEVIEVETMGMEDLTRGTESNYGSEETDENLQVSFASRPQSTHLSQVSATADSKSESTLVAEQSSETPSPKAKDSKNTDNVSPEDKGTFSPMDNSPMEKESADAYLKEENNSNQEKSVADDSSLPDGLLDDDDTSMSCKDVTNSDLTEGKASGDDGFDSWDWKSSKVSGQDGMSGSVQASVMSCASDSIGSAGASGAFEFEGNSVGMLESAGSDFGLLSDKEENSVTASDVVNSGEFTERTSLTTNSSDVLDLERTTTSAGNNSSFAEKNVEADQIDSAISLGQDCEVGLSGTNLEAKYNFSADVISEAGSSKNAFHQSDSVKSSVTDNTPCE
jgi:hypothetical protein